MLDEVIVVAVFLGLAASSVLALRLTAASLKTAVATLVMAGLLTPAVWLASTRHWAPRPFRSFPFAPSEAFADYAVLYLPMSFFVATLLAAILAVGLRRLVRASKPLAKSRLGKS